MQSAADEKTMELEGSLKAFKFPEILQFLAMGRMTGVLGLTQNERRVDLAFREGKIVSGATQARSGRLGQMLVYAGHLKRQHLEEALALQAAGRGDQLLGEILVENKWVEPDHVRDTLRLQLQEEIWDLFAWEEGSFRFEHDAIRPLSSIEVMLDVEPMLLEGSRRLDEWQTIRANIGRPDDVYRVNPDFSGPPETALDPDTWRVLALINGRLSVEAVSRLSNLGKFETYWALNNLIQAEIIVNIDHAPRKQAPPPGKPLEGALVGDPSIYGGADGESGEALAPVDPNSKSEKRGLFGLKKAGASGKSKSFSTSIISTGSSDPDSGIRTDVGLICMLTNRLIGALASDSRFRQAEGASFDFEDLWWRVSERRPKSDLIEFGDLRLHSDLFDRYVSFEGEISAPLVGSHDDSLAAMRLYWERLREEAAKRLDARTVEQIFAGALRAFASNAPAFKTADFTLERWLQEAA